MWLSTWLREELRTHAASLAMNYNSYFQNVNVLLITMLGIIRGSTLSQSLVWEVCLLSCVKNSLIFSKMLSHCTGDFHRHWVPLVAPVSRAPNRPPLVFVPQFGPLPWAWTRSVTDSNHSKIAVTVLGLSCQESWRLFFCALGHPGPPSKKSD